MTPGSGDIEYGEIAVNYRGGGETLIIRNTDDNLVQFKSKDYNDAVYQAVLTAGEGISISGNVISSTLQAVEAASKLVPVEIDDFNEFDYASLGLSTGEAVSFHSTGAANRPAGFTASTVCNGFIIKTNSANFYKLLAFPETTGTAVTFSVGTFNGTSVNWTYYALANTAGVANSAARLATARTISVTGAVTGSASFNGSANVSIATTLSDIDASKITSGTIDIARLPQGALDRMVVVANEAARFQLTTADVQNGDTVKQNDTGLMYYVVDDTNLDNEAGYETYTAGAASSVPFAGVTGKPSTLAGYGITDAYTSTQVDNLLDDKIGTIVIGTTETGEEGTDAEVSVVNNGVSATLSFTIPKGDTGAQGTRGAQGARGVQGTSGAQGARGVQGTSGAQGARGAVGPTGPQGERGTQGDTGAQGSRGAQGETGSQGSRGAQGVRGAQGTRGTEWFIGTAITGTATGGTVFTGSTIDSAIEGDLYLNTSTGYVYECVTGGAASVAEWAYRGSIRGVQGARGAQGPVGVQGARGVVGPTGPQGSRGAQGDTGAQGNRGAQGVIGLVGPTGPQGAQGDRGLAGVQGSRGEAGAQGNRGAQGVIGLVGPTGPQGAQGDRGIAGVQGSRGAAGAQGNRGAQGDTGAQGNRGVQGARGAQGERGSEWHTGTAITGTATGGTVFTGSTISNALAGDMYLNTSTGYVYECLTGGAATVATWAYKGSIRGVQGARGVVGPTGPQGSRGAQGDTGAQGNRGAQGVIGLVGPTGPQGAQGDRGIAGVQGSRGAAGAQGNRGVQGDTGAQGNRGVQGARGAIGERGSEWYTGTAITGTATGGTVFTGSAIASALVGDMYLNTSTGYVYRCTTAGAASVARWAYVGSIRGAAGTQGARGAVGAQGLRGAQGARGVVGPTGPTGPTGAPGEPGSQGDRGAQGPRGVQGARGAVGPTGPTGPTGAPGEPGSQGDRGAQGARGAQGVMGQAGSPGTDGTDGGRWYTGTAITGTSTTGVVFSGSGIASAVVGDMYLNTSTSYVYRCTTAGSASSARWAYVMSIRGATGPTGPQGPRGVQGARGAQGARGTQGVQGVQGPRGIQGARGVQGAIGQSASYRITVSATEPSNPQEGDIWIRI